MKKICNSFKSFIKLIFSSKYFLLFSLYSFFREVCTKLAPIALIDVIVKLYQTNNKFGIIIIYCLLFVLINLINNLVKFIFNKYDDRVERNFCESVDRFIIDKYLTANINFTSKQEFQNDYVKNLQNGSSYVIKNYKCINQILSTFFVYVILLIYLSKYNALISIMSIMILVIYTILGNYTLRFDKDTVDKTKYDNRFRNYIKRVFTLKTYAQDLKTSNISNFLINKNIQLITNSKVITQKNAIKKNNIKIVVNILLKVYLPLSILLISFEYTSDLKLLIPTIVTALLNVTNIMSSLSASLSNYFLNLTNLSQLIDFLKLDFGKMKKVKNSFNSMKFRKVNFKYNNDINFELKNISFSIKKGEKIILVGKNGSGKSTLVKLMMGLLHPYSGKVLYNNKEIYAIDIQNDTAILFQDFQIYATTIAENVLLKKLETEEEEILVKQALISVGLYDKIQALEKGINTIVTKEFDADGVEFSRGEKQKIALARIYASKSNLVILDEPTSSLDVISENVLFENLFIALKEKTIIIVTHKFHKAFEKNRTLYINEGLLYDFENYNDYKRKRGII